MSGPLLSMMIFIGILIVLYLWLVGIPALRFQFSGKRKPPFPVETLRRKQEARNHWLQRLEQLWTASKAAIKPTFTNDATSTAESAANDTATRWFGGQEAPRLALLIGGFCLLVWGALVLLNLPLLTPIIDVLGVQEGHQMTLPVVGTVDRLSLIIAGIITVGELICAVLVSHVKNWPIRIFFGILALLLVGLESYGGYYRGQVMGGAGVMIDSGPSTGGDASQSMLNLIIGFIVPVLEMVAGVFAFNFVLAPHFSTMVRLLRIPFFAIGVGYVNLVFAPYFHLIPDVDTKIEPEIIAANEQANALRVAIDQCGSEIKKIKAQVTTIEAQAHTLLSPGEQSQAQHPHFSKDPHSIKTTFLAKLAEVRKDETYTRLHAIAQTRMRITGEPDIMRQKIDLLLQEEETGARSVIHTQDEFRDLHHRLTTERDTLANALVAPAQQHMQTAVATLRGYQDPGSLGARIHGDLQPDLVKFQGELQALSAAYDSLDGRINVCANRRRQLLDILQNQCTRIMAPAFNVHARDTNLSLVRQACITLGLPAPDTDFAPLRTQCPTAIDQTDEFESVNEQIVLCHKGLAEIDTKLTPLLTAIAEKPRVAVKECAASDHGLCGQGCVICAQISNDVEVAYRQFYAEYEQIKGMLEAYIERTAVEIERRKPGRRFWIAFFASFRRDHHPEGTNHDKPQD